MSGPRPQPTVSPPAMICHPDKSGGGEVAGGSAHPLPAQRTPADEAEAHRSIAWVRSILEGTQDAICVTDPGQMVTDYNDRFLQMWRISPETLARRDPTEIQEAVRRQLADPGPFFRRIEEIRHSGEPETLDVIRLADGRVFERFSRLQVVEGRPVGRVWSFHDITARRRAEELLLRNEAELRALADSMAQLAWMAEPDGHIYWYNRRWFEYTGTTLDQMRGWGWQSVHDPAVLPQVVARWRSAIRSGQPWEMEFPLRGADGVFRWFLTRAIPSRDPSGRVTRWFGTNTDVDRAKRAEDALREETRVLELLNRTGRAIASQLDLPGLLRTVTDAGTELSGARFGAFFYTDSAGAEDTRRGAKGFELHAWSGSAPSDAGRACVGRGRFLSRVFHGDAPVRRADSPGEVADAGFPPTRSYVAIPVRSRSGEVLGGLFFGHPEPDVFDARTERVLLGVAAQAGIAIDNARLYESAQREIAGRSRTEQRLREGEARLRVSLETAALGTWELDARTGLVTLDARAQELFEPVGAPTITLEEFLALGDPDSLAERREALRATCAGERERFDAEFRLAASGRWVKASATPVRDAGGAIVRAVGGVLDVTDMMRARATIEERRRELERLVEERTASLHQAIAQMEEFSYSVSHDLRAPLRAIQGYAQAVLEDCGEALGERGRDHLGRILRAGERMDRLTRDVLTYSRIARGAAPLTELSLDRLVGDAIEQYVPSRRRDGEIEVERPLLPVRGHEPLLVQAISNLLANAFKFVAEGVRPRVRVRTERRGEEVRLWVEDNGIGVRPEHASRIWGMFERVHPPEKYEGTGIGLAIVRKAVERMGGAVGVESDGRNGSRFWLQLRGA
jgi:PAS domain S-box-containing protein